MTILVRTVPAYQIRNHGAGDWSFTPNGVLVVEVAEMDKDSAICVAVHEIVEALLCQKHGVTDEAVTAWDAASPDEEPGEHPQAPYFREHMVALEIEKMLCTAQGHLWDAHEERITRALKG